MRHFLLFLLLILSMTTYAQIEKSDAFQKHFDLARKYDYLSLYAEAIEEISEAIQIADKNNWEDKHIEASIFLAEIFRKTKDYNEGIELLKNLKNSAKYTDLHVEKLGRLSALYHECDLPNEQKYDSVERYLYRAIALAEQHQLKHHKAALYNELGFRMGHNRLDSCMYLLGEASRIFMEVGDTQNYIVARTNMLRTYETIHDDENVQKTFAELRELVTGNNWYTLEREVYSTISAYYFNRQDTVNYNYWMVKCQESELLNLERISSNRLNSYRAVYETRKYQNQITKKERELKKESRRRGKLLLYLGILFFLIIGISIFLLRERRLKKSLRKANDNYQMLIIESNHRIKNNLQMIISMLNYDAKDSSKEATKAYEIMSSKIYTISALHKHLYADVHNERVDLGFYFGEIIKLHKDIALSEFKITSEIDSVSIRSERIVYFGLIFNEMLSNTFEHGNAPSKELFIRITKQHDHFEFSYQDNSHFHAESKQGRGIILIQELVRRVRGTNYQLDAHLGKYAFHFKSD